ncbi:uncharacterized protein LOC120999169 [Bufo bufo]|uniref:uncharacterized protein LOC120999169 n=1 Tax=Bufo bufo TaxID=8384 RepID=UPI001ABEB7F8|nr:uncharacterized protein LOC120999169 [Bufo bufo]
MIGPFTSSPFSSWRTNPIGIAVHKYSNKKRMIIDLSAPHSSFVPSINALIPADEFSLQYVKIDDAIQTIISTGSNAWLSKTDITNAFKLLPMHPSLWHLHGVKWRNKYYFSTRLTFGSRSSPKLFDIFAETLCWLLLNIIRCHTVIHYLDDFLIIEPSTRTPTDILSTSALFATLGVPLSPAKTIGPTTKLTFLGIELDYGTFRASLPPEKLVRLRGEIDMFLRNNVCTRKELQSLLGSLNFAMRIVPQGRSFVSRLLCLLHGVPDACPIALDHHAKADLLMWGKFLTQWNGISMFIPPLSDSSPCIYTDAAASTGFAAIFGNHWFRGHWPAETDALPGFRETSALFEIYPIVAAAHTWGHLWSGKAVKCYSDNSSACDIINKGRSSSLTMMRLIRKLTWLAATVQFHLICLHIPGIHNTAADALSRSQFQVFFQALPSAHHQPSRTPNFYELILD